MGDLISKARKGRLAALQGRSHSTLFPEGGSGAAPARKTVVPFPSRRVVTVFS